MALTLTSGATVITLPEDIQWVDEFGSWKVQQISETSLTGALIVHESAKLAGRPLTFQSGSDFAWAPLSTVNALRALEDVAGGPNMALSVPGYPSGQRAFTVRFRRDPVAIEAAPIKHQTPPAPADWYSLVLRLMEVA